MKRKTTAALLIAAGIAAAGSTASAESEMKYTAVVENYDWGASVKKLIVDLGDNPPALQLTPDEVRVTVRKTYEGTDRLVQTMDYAKGQFVDAPGAAGERRVEAVYACDEEGERTGKPGDYVAIELTVTPKERLGDVLGMETETGLRMNAMLDCHYTVSLTGAKQEVYICDTQAGVKNILSDKFVHNQIYTSSSEEVTKDAYENETLYYASYEPEDQEKHPLIIWLHGMGEGGTDTRVTVTGNRVTRLVDEEIQTIMGGAYVLAPQTPTIWMNTEGAVDTANIGITKENMQSIYTKTLMELIQSYVEAHPQIDTDRIYLGGCSNGGYMTMNMLLTYPEYFAAAFPVCEAYNDAFITDEQIELLSQIPIWFTCAENDKVVASDRFSVPTYGRLREAQAENVHFTYWTDVHDTTGEFVDKNGNPAQYIGHFSWIYVLNNACTADLDYVNGQTADGPGSGTTIFEWLADQVKQSLKNTESS